MNLSPSPGLGLLPARPSLHRLRHRLRRRPGRAENHRRAPLLPRVRELGATLQARLKERFADHSYMGDVRGRGLLQGLELVREHNDERLVYRLGHTLYSTRRVGDALYALVARTLNVFQVRRGTDTPLPFAEP